MSTQTQSVQESVESDTAIIHTVDGASIEAAQVVIKANGWVKADTGHLPPHRVKAVDGDSSRGGPVVYEKPHGRV